MALNYKQGNILTAFKEGEFNVLLHQTNCVTKSRVSGIAKSIFEEYPKALQVHLIDCNFAQYSFETVSAKNGFIQGIINCNSQYYQGACNDYFFDFQGFTILDNFQNRLRALELILEKVVTAFDKSFTFGIPLIASGIGADRTKKGSMRDLEYFQKFIAPTVEKYLPNCTVYYL